MANSRHQGSTWQLQHAPIITLPRKYVKDAAIAGYGELGSSLLHDGHYYAHVSRHYNNNTGAGPPNTVATGTCVFRTADPTDPATYRGWCFRLGLDLSSSRGVISPRRPPNHTRRVL